MFSLYTTVPPIFSALILLKVYVKLRTKWCTSYKSLVGKTAIVTGSNTGIGYWTALDLAKRGCKVILACRSQEKAEIAQRNIIEATKNNDVYVRIINMESLNSVRNFAKEFNQTEERLDILVNNAGGVLFGDRYTEDNLQVTMQVNHFSSVLLTELLLEKLKKSAPSRIINVSSEAAKLSKLTLEDLNKLPNGSLSQHKAYANSKLCNILFTTELAKRLVGTGITVNVLHPGVVKTELGRNSKPFVRKIIHVIGLMYFKTSEEGAQTTIHLCVSDEVESLTGRLFKNCKEIKLYKSALVPNLSKEIWEKSREYVGLK